MNNDIFTEENSLDMFDMEIPQLNTETLVQQSPQALDGSQSEFDSFVNKSFISFGTMAVCIVFIIIFAIIFKNKKKKNEITIQKQKEEMLETEPEYMPAQKKEKRQTLNTPSSIHKCIKSFLENTKDV